MIRKAMLALAVAVVVAAGLATAESAAAATPWGSHVEGLRYQAEARAYGWRPTAPLGQSARGLRAEGLRYQEEARVYLLQDKGRSNRALAYGLIGGGVLVTAGAGFLLVRVRARKTSASPAVAARAES